MWQLAEEYGLATPKGREGESAPRTGEEEAQEYGRALKKFITYCFEYFPETYAQKKIKFYLRVSSVWLNFGHSLTKKLGKCSNIEEYHAVIDQFFQAPGLKFANYTMLTY